MLGLTKKQYSILKYIQDHIAENNYSPSFREIQQHFHFSSVGTVYNYIRLLKSKGFISTKKQRSRSLTPANEIAKNFFRSTKISIVGTIQGGFPIEFYDKCLEIELPPTMVRSDTNIYALRVKGHGFLEELIADHDIIIVEARKKAFDGETVIVSLNRLETLIKKFFSVENYVRLEAITPHHQPIIVRENHFEILGVVVSIIRNF